MLTLLASIAQEQSRSDSENIKWRIRKSFENGEDICLSMMYGYDKADTMFILLLILLIMNSVTKAATTRMRQPKSIIVD